MRLLAAPRLSTLLLLVVAWPAMAAAQIGVATDILTGRVAGPTGEPLHNAAVTATSLDTGIQRSTLTNAEGRYTLIFPDGGGRYELRFVRLGMGSLRIAVARDQATDVLITDVRLEVAPIVLTGIIVHGEAEGPAAGPHERALDGEWLTLLPIDPMDLASIARLEPAVVGLEATDSIGSGGFSVLGQRPDLNHISVDGASFGSPRGSAGGGLGIPPEAVRLTRVITNSYDVSRGQFSGGQIATTTRGGTNRRQGSITYSLYEPRLQWYAESAPFNPAYTQHRLSGGIGGPIVRDRLFYFGSAALQHRSQGLRSLMQADAAALGQLGAHPDSVERFLSILRGHRLSPTEPVAASQQLIEELSLFGRVDYTISDRHSLMLRGDALWNRRDGTQISALGLPHSGGQNDAAGGGTMLALTSRFGERWINEFRAYLGRHDSDAGPYFPVPEGRVQVVSELDDGARSVANLVFGGNRSLPVTSTDRTLEASNELSWLRSSRHRVRLGMLLHLNRSAQEFSPTQHGSFSFASLADFAANRPTSYTRSLTRALKRGGGLNAALYLGDTWQASRELQLTYGLRAEVSQFGRQPAYNARLDSLFDRRTDRFPAELHVSPRFGFTYTLAEARGGLLAPGTVRGGIGVFRGRPPFSLYSTALDATGLPDGQVQITCVGDAVPLPDWLLYRDDRTSIPDACADGERPQPASGRAPSATVFRPGFSAPRSWRASLGVERRVRRHFQLSFDATFNRGSHLYGVRDLNLDAVPRFGLEAEGGRPVYVDAASIVQTSGAVGMLNSRRHPEFGHVLELHSGLRSRAVQLTTGVQANLPSKLALRVAYSASWASDESSFSCCSALQGFGSPTSAGDPNQAEWGPSNFERRHTFNANANLPLRSWMELAVVGRTASGAPFTPLVGGDINGDGVRNDRAFVFDPAFVQDSAIAAGMSRLLADAPARIRGCLRRQLGEVASRNSCHGPWQSSLELRANLRPELPRLGRRLTASVASQNLLTGVDQLLNSAGGLRGWGQTSSPDATLLYPRAFDAATRSFRYEVNERFGNARQGQIPFGSPFQLHLEARVALGQER